MWGGEAEGLWVSYTYHGGRRSTHQVCEEQGEEQRVQASKRGGSWVEGYVKGLAHHTVSQWQQAVVARVSAGVNGPD